MVALGCNYSPQLMNLLRTGAADVDWIKLSRRETLAEEIERCRPLKPLLLHTLPHASMDPARLAPWADVNDTVALCGSPHIALHLAAEPQDYDVPEPSDEDVIRRLQEGVGAWKRLIRSELLIENVPYYGFRGTLRAACEPDTIAFICEREDVGLLLDTAHLRVAASHMGMEAERYMDGLPLDRVREIHVSGPAPDPDEGYLRDRHLELQEPDYALLERLLARTAPRMVTLEYGGTGPKMEWRSEEDVLLRQLSRLRTILSRCGY